jgi:energy-coupling factor transporter ATP-binding protein EcfA2
MRLFEEIFREANGQLTRELDKFNAKFGTELNAFEIGKLAQRLLSKSMTEQDFGEVQRTAFKALLANKTELDILDEDDSMERLDAEIRDELPLKIKGLSVLIALYVEEVGNRSWG